MLVVTPLGQIHKLALGVSSVVLSWSVDVVLRIGQKLHPMSDPSDHSRNSEQDREHISWEAHRPVDQSTVKINVRVKLARDAE